MNRIKRLNESYKPSDEELEVVEDYFQDLIDDGFCKKMSVENDLTLDNGEWSSRTYQHFRIELLSKLVNKPTAGWGRRQFNSGGDIDGITNSMESISDVISSLNVVFKKLLRDGYHVSIESDENLFDVYVLLNVENLPSANQGRTLNRRPFL